MRQLGLALGSFLLVAGDAMASAGPGEPHLNLWVWDNHAPPVGWFILDFVIFVAILRWVVKKFVVPALAKRSFGIRRGIAEAHEANETARSHRDGYAAKLAAVAEESKSLVAEASRDGQAMKEQLEASADAYAKRLTGDVDVIVAQEASALARELHDAASDRVVTAAEARIRDAITDADRTRLFDEALAQLAAETTETSVGGRA